jgi:hypothetical protein
MIIVTIIYYEKIVNNHLCTGIYQEMRALEGGEPAAPTDLTAEEEEELLYGSEDDTLPTEEEAEKARIQAEKEAEEADLNAKQAELQERIRRRKAERKQRMEEQLKLEQAAMLAEQERIRGEAEAEKAAHRRQIEKLEEQLRQARSSSGRNDEGEDGEDEMYDNRPVYPKRDRSGSDDSRHESTASSSLGANRFNLPAGYKAVRSAKLNSLAVRHLNGGSAIPFKPIGSFTDEKDPRIKLANTISDANSSRNISSSFNLESFICNTCTSRGEHVVLGKKIDGNDGTKQSPPPALSCLTKTSPR